MGGTLDAAPAHAYQVPDLQLTLRGQFEQRIHDPQVGKAGLHHGGDALSCGLVLHAENARLERLGDGSVCKVVSRRAARVVGVDVRLADRPAAGNRRLLVVPIPRRPVRRGARIPVRLVEKVRVLVTKTRSDEGAAQVDDAGVLAHPSHDVAVGADGGDPLSDHGDSLGERPVPVPGPDLAGAKHQIGRLLRGTRRKRMAQYSRAGHAQACQLK